ncbi:hypothetical protein [Bacillus cereus]|uniref:hypothetical protein n=1 Tax=Bacillus cereus TaxID=1396 RepID=UPI0015C05D07|nr:hypothetical protein [Bacillus cereus]
MEKKPQPVLKERARHTVSMQERLLQEVIQKKKVTSVILINGFHMKGIMLLSKNRQIYS